MKYRCPVCLYGALPYPAADYHICPCCSTEFGNDDEGLSHERLREMWVGGGAHWFFGNPPQYWNPWIQLIDGGHPEAVPRLVVSLTVSAPNVIVGPTAMMSSMGPFQLVPAA